MHKSILAIATLLALCAVPGGHAQVTQSAQINSNTLNSTSNIVTLDTAATALSLQVSTAGTLSCSTYPVITFIVTRNAVNTTLAVITTSNAASWTASPLFTTLLAGDLIFAKLTTSGIGCTNELPLTVSATYSPLAGLCDSNPSACVTLTGVLAGPNGLPFSNGTITFKPSQMAFLGGVPPSNPAPPAGGGPCGGSAPNSAVCSADLTTEYGDAHFEYDRTDYGKSYVVIDLSAGISSGSIAKNDEQFGYTADASSDASTGNTAVGSNSQAIGGNATSLGYTATATASGAIAIGGSELDALASGVNSIAIGTNAFAASLASIAMGDAASASDLSTVAIGDAPEIDSGAARSVAIGNGVFIAAGGTSSVVIGDGARNNVSGAGFDSCNAIGNGAYCLGSDSTAIGEGSAAAEDSVALGYGNAPGQESIAIGYGYAAGYGSTVIGDGTDQGHDDVVIVAGSDVGGATATAAHQAIIGTGTTTDFWLGDPSGTGSPVTMHNIAGGSAGHGICWKTDTTLGYCSSALDSSGNCTCN